MSVGGLKRREHQVKARYQVKANPLLTLDQLVEQEKPVGLTELRCAQRALADRYSFVGVLERQEETICQLTRALGLQPGAYKPTPKAVRRCAWGIDVCIYMYNIYM